MNQETLDANKEKRTTGEISAVHFLCSEAKKDFQLFCFYLLVSIILVYYILYLHYRLQYSTYNERYLRVAPLLPTLVKGSVPPPKKYIQEQTELLNSSVTYREWRGEVLGRVEVLCYYFITKSLYWSLLDVF